LSGDVENSGERSSQFQTDLVTLVSVENLQITQNETLEEVVLVDEELVLESTL
jgi:hypothetical protein